MLSSLGSAQFSLARSNAGWKTHTHTHELNIHGSGARNAICSSALLLPKRCAAENGLCKISKPYTDSQCCYNQQGQRRGDGVHTVPSCMRWLCSGCGQDELCAGPGGRYGHYTDFRTRFCCVEYFRIANLPGVLLGSGFL